MERRSDEPSSIKKLLLVEDNIATAARLGERLAQQADYQVIVASDFVTAMKFMRSFKPNLVLLDERLLTVRWVPDERFVLTRGCDCPVR